ncbi:MAG: tetratricopeptide repeat protein, partial [Coleofasciculaceae cyanobacterium SM2_3_26]|nr:tetratricopeptide repeat protein [Coleofasciculaceae cyanobacterium SM2_3_26]
ETALKAAGLRSYAEGLVLVGNLTQAQTLLQQSLDLAEQLGVGVSLAEQHRQEQGTALFGFGSIARLQRRFADAQDFYQEAALATPDPLFQVQAQLNHLSTMLAAESTPRTVSPVF